MMTWPPVVTDCLGSPELVAGYAMLLMAVWIAGWYDCPTDGGALVQCPIYARSPWLDAGFTVAPAWNLLAAPVPPVGGVDIYRPVTVDAAGNTSEEACP